MCPPPRVRFAHPPSVQPASRRACARDTGPGHAAARHHRRSTHALPSGPLVIFLSTPLAASSAAPPARSRSPPLPRSTAPRPPSTAAEIRYLNAGEAEPGSTTAETEPPVRAESRKKSNPPSSPSSASPGRRQGRNPAINPTMAASVSALESAWQVCPLSSPSLPFRLLTPYLCSLRISAVRETMRAAPDRQLYRVPTRHRRHLPDPRDRLLPLRPTLPPFRAIRPLRQVQDPGILFFATALGL
jgi:hypothetical protein